jgi:prepilin-type N-terminal cleavage/methylation domain-containing protein
MKQKTTRDKSAMTLIEVIVVIAVIAVLLSMLLPALSKPKKSRGGPSCVNNLHQIGIAYQVWAGDNGDLLPAQQSVSKGGWADLLTNANQGAICWTNYAILSNDLGGSRRVLICPADERVAATNFTTDFNDTHISYFVGARASLLLPQSILGGDRNLSPGARPELDFGYSHEDGKGNDVAIPLSGPVSWSLKMHSDGVLPGFGVFLFADGSEVKTSTATLNQFLSNSVPTTNWPAGHVSRTPSIRLIFP